MKRHLHPLLLIASLPAAAQPSLVYPDAAPDPGQSFLTKYGPYQAEGPAGAGQTWDFASLAADSANITYIMAPGDAPGGSGFPTATAAIVNGDQATFAEAQDIGLFYMAASILGQQVVFDQPAQYLNYPCTYQSGWEGTYTGTISLFGFDVDLTGSVIGLADAYGTLILPEATVTDVLRVKRDDVTTISTPLGDFLITSVSYLFFKPGIDLPILELTDTQGDIPGAPVDVQRLQWMDVTSIGVAENGANAFGIEAFPNPANGPLTLRFGTGIEIAAIDMIDMLGRTVLAPIEGSRASGPGTITLDVSGLPSGMYTVRLVDRAGNTGFTRIEVQ